MLTLRRTHQPPHRRVRRSGHQVLRLRRDGPGRAHHEDAVLQRGLGHEAPYNIEGAQRHVPWLIGGRRRRVEEDGGRFGGGHGREGVVDLVGL